MQDRPSALELLAAVRAFLDEEIVPVLEGRRRFHALVAANVLGIVERELTSEEDVLAGEWQRLATLLGSDDAGRPPTLALLRARVRHLTTVLAARIRAGEADGGPFADAARVHARATVVEKLGIARPAGTGS